MITKATAKMIIVRNGHLQLEGDESVDEMREALYNLRKHTYNKCARPMLGTPIEVLLPDISALAPTHKPRNVQRVDATKERL